MIGYQDNWLGPYKLPQMGEDAVQGTVTSAPTAQEQVLPTSKINLK